MCDPCVINNVKERMLRESHPSDRISNRKNNISSPGPQTLSKGHNIVVDLTHTLSPDFPTFPGHQQMFVRQTVEYSKNGYNLFELRYEEHVGTHVDAPLHFSADGCTVDELDIGHLVSPLCIIDIRHKSALNADVAVEIDDIETWLHEHGEFPENACVSMLSGWSENLGSDKFRNTDADGIQHYPGFSGEAAEYLITQTAVASIGVDTLSLDCGANQDFDVHQLWLPSGRFGVEALANLDQLPACGASIVIGAPKHKGGTGGPARVFGLL